MPLAPFRERLAAGTACKPYEVIGSVLHLACDESSWTTGSLLVVDGGNMVMRPQPSSQR